MLPRQPDSGSHGRGTASLGGATGSRCCPRLSRRRFPLWSPATPASVMAHHLCRASFSHLTAICLFTVCSPVPGVSPQQRQTFGFAGAISRFFSDLRTFQTQAHAVFSATPRARPASTSQSWHSPPPARLRTERRDISNPKPDKPPDSSHSHNPPGRRRIIEQGAAIPPALPFTALPMGPDF